MLCLHAQQVLLHQVDSTFEILQACSFRTFVRIGDEDVDVGFMLRKKWVDVRLVDQASALGLRQDEVREETETDVGVERGPGDDEEGPVFDEGEAGDDDPVHEPWSQLGRVGGTEGFVGGEDGEEDGENGA